MYDKIIMIMTEMAEKGRLMIKFEDLCDLVAEGSNIASESASRCIKKAENMNLLHIIKRSFGSIRTVIFVSLKLEIVSLEALHWTLRSLKVDEMMPTERAIQSRMKETFDLKPSATQWTSLMETILKSREQRHEHSRS